MMDKSALAKLIQYIAFEVQDRDIPILRTRLVKLIYLVELEFFRSRRERLSDLKWIRYLYGPFSFDLNQVTARLGFQLQEEDADFASGHGIVYQVEEPRDIDKALPFFVKSLADRVVSRWADEDLDALLDYVYLETEPMLTSTFGEELDFSKVLSSRRPSVLEEIEFNEDELDEIRKLLQEHKPLGRAERFFSLDRDLLQALGGLEGHMDSQDLSGRVGFSKQDDKVGWEGRE